MRSKRLFRAASVVPRAGNSGPIKYVHGPSFRWKSPCELPAHGRAKFVGPRLGFDNAYVVRMRVDDFVSQCDSQSSPLAHDRVTL
jgi:hypothetical protein